ncbi:MAG TPA: non-homologous end-joining DNA ligase, partial [Vicinamibacteria bacterium]|nr:non-homologous end-joining DNA ligase [Vicinamibacteria bacterium]
MSWEPSRLSGAIEAPFPVSPRPQLATLVKEVPAGDDWLHEIKHDGYRLLCSIRDGRARLLSRNGLDWTDKLSRLASSAKELPAREAVLDGEIVILRSDGTSDFQALQKTIGGANPSGLTYYLFDVIYGDGRDLRHVPLVDRKELLRSLLEGTPSDRLQYSEHVQGHGAAVLERACALGAEGIVSKLRTSFYEPRRTRTWLKIKCSHRQEFVVVGYTEPEGSRTGFGALLLAVYDEERRLVFSGQVGTGFTEKMLQDLMVLLEERAQDEPPFESTPRELKRAHWVRPELVAEVEFTEWTSDGRLRHPSFKGLRFDKPPSEVRR